ncbi:MAG: hypothetical protein PUB98_00745 [Clostridiales bacterium]|nr:hypothetical protein [Clostridiales bacterium]
MDRKIKIGVLGGYRGSSMINYCERADNVEIVAICDKSAEVLNCQREKLKDENITYFDNFEDFIKHDMDAVVLANYYVLFNDNLICIDFCIAVYAE